MLMIIIVFGFGIDYLIYYVYCFKEYIVEGYDYEKVVVEVFRRVKDVVFVSVFIDIIVFVSFVLVWEFLIF